MREVRLSKALLSDEEVAALEGVHLDDSSYEQLFSGEDVEVYKPDGSLLLKLVTNRLDPILTKSGYKVLRKAARRSWNRGAAAGKTTGSEHNAAGTQGNVRYRWMKQDGTIAKRLYSIPVDSGVVGFLDRYTTYPYCRQTAFTMDHQGEFMQALPLIQRVDQVFQEAIPGRYEAQRARVMETHPHFYIPGTVFTTITVNRNWQTAVHTDKGDLREGFGVMLAFRAGNFSGCHLVFPQYGVAAEMRTGDILFGDVHEWHGNSPIRGIPGRYERISLVCYYREKMVYCGSAEQEHQLAKTRKPGDPLHVKPETLSDAE